MTSKIKVDNINKVSDDSNIIKKCGTTITLGASGDSIALASGASQTGFGRTGTVDWQTAIKTSTITVVNGEGYFVNTTGGAITANLPAGSAGAIAAFRDYANTFDSNNLIISSNGSEKINGGTLDLTVSTEGESITLVYADATKGWLVVNDGNNDAGAQASFVTATSPCVATVGDYKIHTFTGPGTFAVSNAGNVQGSNTVDYLVIAGGGAGGASGPQSISNAGGGAGGYRESSGAASGCYTASPLGACVAALPVSVQSYTITVGGGASVQSNPTPGVGGSGSVSTFSTITSAGGGGGGSDVGGANGGSGGGGSREGYAGGTGNTPPVSPPQGNNGGPGGSPVVYAGGGGGAGAVGTTGGPSASPGGNGVTTSINNTPTTRSGGGGTSATGTNTSGAGGTGGAGNGGNISAGGNGTVNTGSGGGGGFNGYPTSATRYQGGGGGSGIVIIRYKFQ